MDKKKLMYAGIGAAVIVLVIVLACVFANKNNERGAEQPSNVTASVEEENKTEGTEEAETSEKTSETVETAETAEEEKVYTPTFMYFVSKNDAKYDEAMKAVDELKSEFDGKVKFDIVDVDENPDAKKNFEMVDGNTPFLIMLNTKNDICAFEFMCSDKDKLKADIENALK